MAPFFSYVYENKLQNGVHRAIERTKRIKNEKEFIKLGNCLFYGCSYECWICIV